MQFNEHASGLNAVTSGSYYAIGMMVMFLLSNAIHRGAKMVRERQSDRYKRMIASPADRAALAGGHLVSSFLILLLQGAVVLLCARYILGIHLGPSSQTILLLISYATSLAGISILLGSWVTSVQVVDSLAGIGSNIAAVLGGSIFPLYGSPQFMQWISRALPNGQAVTELVEGKVQTKFVTDSQRVMMGFATMFIVFTVFASTGSLFLEREKGTWNRVKASPANKASILAGYGLGFFAVGWLQFLILYLVGRLLFGIVIPLNAIAILLMSLYVLAVCGIALTVAGTVKSNEQHMMIGSFVGTSTSMIGGAYWPLEIEPTWMQHLAWFVPQSWALSGFKATALGLSSMTSIGLPLAVLAGFAVIFFGVGMVQLRYS